MEFGRNLFVFFLVCLSSFLSATEGYKFYVGGRDGWVLNPSENYNHWAERRRFQVNDTLCKIDALISLVVSFSIFWGFDLVLISKIIINFYYLVAVVFGPK